MNLSPECLTPTKLLLFNRDHCRNLLLGISSQRRHKRGEMAFRPTSMVGAFGGIASMLSFLINVVATLSSKFDDYTECQIGMSQYRVQLEAVLAEFTVWDRIWCLDSEAAFPESTYKYFWGERVFRTIKEGLHNMKYEIGKINDILYAGPKLQGKKSIEASEREVWRKMLPDFHESKEVNSVPEPLPAQHESVTQKLGFARITSSTHNDRLGRLEAGLAGLKKISRISFWNLQDGPEDANRPVFRSDLAELHAKKTGVQRFAKFATELKAEMDHSVDDWRLVLGQPTVEELLGQSEKK